MDGSESYRKFLSGSDEAIGDIIALYKDSLVLFLLGFTDDPRTAEELAVDTFARIAIKRPEYSGRSSFKTWLFSIARHVAADYMRKNLRFIRISLSDCTLTDMTDIENDIIKNEQHRLLHTHLRQLKPQYRQVLTLSYFEGMSNEEIAAIMGKSCRQIENLNYNAKKALRKQLEKEGLGYDDF